MDSYYILSLNNNIYAVSRNGVKLDYSLSTVFDDNDTDSNFYINSYGGCMIIGKEIEGKMYDFFTDEEIRYIKVGSDKDVPYLSYYEKRKIPKSLVVLMLERYRKINILRYINAINEIKKRNMELYGLRINDDDKICLLDEFSNPDKYISEFKCMVRKINLLR